MARPRKSALQRKELLDIGLLLISEQGYNGTGLKQIVDRAGIPKGSFYNYFPSKEDFVIDVLEQYTDQLLVRMKKYDSSASDSAKGVIRSVHEGLISLFEQGIAQSGCMIGNLAAELGAGSTEVQKRLNKSLSDWKAAYAKLFKQAQDDGEIRSDIHPNLLAELFWNQWQGALLQMQIENSTTPPQNALNFMLDDFLDAK